MRPPRQADLIVVGGGPAGLSAAVEARRHGLSVLLLDENAAPGGRIWQAIEARRGSAHDRDDQVALDSVAAFRACGAEVQYGATLWAVEDGAAYWSEGGGAAHSAAAPEILLATGTTERPVPIPGWTLPGVMTVGAAQILLKTSGLAPTDGRTWIAGQGPLLLLYAVQALRAGARIAGVLDLSALSGGGDWRAAAGRLPGALASPTLLRKGLAWRAELARVGVPWLRAASGLRAEGDGTLERVRFQVRGRERVERATLLLLHDGVVPSVQVTRALGCAHRWDAAQRCWRPVVDQWGATSVPGIRVAGDGAGVGGWQAAALGGKLAALGAACALGRIDTAERDRLARPLRVRQARRLALRPLLDALYPPLRHRMADEAVVCRCEEVSAGRIREAVGLGCLGLNQLKAFTRCGMGPCQGRMCAATAAEVVAAARGVPVGQVEPLRMRFPTKPLTLGELASLDA